ncbi:hypothetical protein LZD49_28580 [Dyadobacter sp. CY261]|uniref:hypothetical protein n=1 Tax=Dyadobacter sp. CY261 TaxID=2907203 RepID=UPI001F39C9D8|nr:hypothetical protein [Dyadobacter sp. CY261]MCF0074475.1 hypothetical protein [Dyadobacter sp. CY261]
MKKITFLKPHHLFSYFPGDTVSIETKQAEALIATGYAASAKDVEVVDPVEEQKEVVDETLKAELVDHKEDELAKKEAEKQVVTKAGK